MKKEFNITGTCYPEDHYMMDDTRRFEDIMELVERGKYFTINRPRQYGKTTMLNALLTQLEAREDYLPILMNFQGISQSNYESSDAFARFFFHELRKGLKYAESGLSGPELEKIEDIKTLDDLSDRITQIVSMVRKKIVLLIDEVDASSNYEPFLHFLGMLRNKYLRRKTAQHRTFHSVVLAGVHDIKSLKFKLRRPEDAQYNSPWNIATDFEVAMEFTPPEIAHMLRQYSQEEGVSMDFEALSEKLHYYTSGYPFLVSKLCKNIAEKILPNKADKSCWTLDDLEESVQLILKEEQNTNFDSLIKNLENNPDLYNLVCRVLIEGEFIPFNPDASLARLGRIYGIFKGNQGAIAIHNRIYEQRIYGYLTARRIEEKQPETTRYVGSQFTKDDGSLDLAQVLRRFQAFMKEQYSPRDSKMKEREWRLIFLSYLKPILNGQGYDFKEVETSEEKRLDIVVTYMQWRYIIELKRWNGEKAHERGLNQLANYLEAHSVTEGWLLIFDTRATPAWEEQIIHHNGKEIFAVWV